MKHAFLSMQKNKLSVLAFLLIFTSYSKKNNDDDNSGGGSEIFVK